MSGVYLTQVKKVDGVDDFTLFLTNLTCPDLMFDALSKFFEMGCEVISFIIESQPKWF